MISFRTLPTADGSVCATYQVLLDGVVIGRISKTRYKDNTPWMSFNNVRYRFRTREEAANFMVKNQHMEDNLPSS